MIDLGSSRVGASAIEGFELDELAIQKGLLQVSEALDFIHSTVSSVHLDIQPSSVLINVKGDWKLFGLGFVESLKGDTNEYFIPRFDGRLPPYIQINFDYAAPELVLDHKLDPANDIFSLGALLITLFTSHPPMRTDNSASVYKQEFQNLNRLLRDPRIPKYLYDLLPQMLARYPNNRISLSELKNSPLFDNILIRTINFLDDFPAKLPGEQQAFMSGFSQLIDQFPKSVLQKKILPAFLEELGKEEVLVGPILTNILIIGKDMSQLGFSEKIVPALRKVKDTLSAKVTTLNNIEILKSRVKGDEFRDEVLPIVLDAMETAPPEIQEVALEKVPIYIEKLDFITLKNDVFPKVGSVFAKTTSLAVKIESLKAFEHLVSHGLDKYAVTEKLLPLLSSMKTREPSVMMGSLNVYSKVVSLVEVEVLARQVIPQLLNMSMESMLNHSQFRQFMEEIHKVLDRVEKEHGKRLSQVTVNGTNGGIGRSGSRSGTGGANGTDGSEEGTIDFKDLVFGKAHIGSTNISSSSRNGSSNDVSRSSQVSSPISNEPKLASPSTGPKTISPLMPFSSISASSASASSFSTTNITSGSNISSSFGALKLEPSNKKTLSPTTFKPLSPPPQSPATHNNGSTINWGNTVSSSSTSNDNNNSMGFRSTGGGSMSSTFGVLSPTSSSSTSNKIPINSNIASSASTMYQSSVMNTTPSLSSTSTTINWGSTNNSNTSSNASNSSGGIDWSKAAKPKPASFENRSYGSGFQGSNNNNHITNNNSNNNNNAGNSMFTSLKPLQPQQPSFSLAGLTPSSSATSSSFGQTNNNNNNNTFGNSNNNSGGGGGGDSLI